MAGYGGAVRRKTSTLTVGGGTLYPRRGDGLVIGDGEDREVVRVLAVRESQVTVGGWRWYHSVAWHIRRWSSVALLHVRLLVRMAR